MERAISAATAPIAPTIGGALTDFQQRFGAATGSSGLMYAATIAGQRALILLTFDEPSQSQDGQQLAAIALRVGCLGTGYALLYGRALSFSKAVRE